MVLGCFEELAEDMSDIRGVEMDLQGSQFETAGGEGKERERCGLTTVGDTGRAESKAFYVGECIGEFGDIFIRQQKSATAFH